MIIINKDIVFNSPESVPAILIINDGYPQAYTIFTGTACPPFFSLSLTSSETLESPIWTNLSRMIMEKIPLVLYISWESDIQKSEKVIRKL